MTSTDDILKRYGMTFRACETAIGGFADALGALGAADACVTENNWKGAAKYAQIVIVILLQRLRAQTKCGNEVISQVVSPDTVKNFKDALYEAVDSKDGEMWLTVHEATERQVLFYIVMVFLVCLENCKGRH